MVTLDTQRGQWYLVGTVSWGVDCGKKDRYGANSLGTSLTHSVTSHAGLLRVPPSHLGALPLPVYPSVKPVLFEFSVVLWPI